MQQSDFEQIPNEFVCPISYGIMKDPVMTEDGHTFERSQIQRWFSMGKSKNPITNLPLHSKKLVTNFALKNAIASYQQKTKNNNTVQAGRRFKLFQQCLSQERLDSNPPKILDFKMKMNANQEDYEQWKAKFGKTAVTLCKYAMQFAFEMDLDLNESFEDQNKFTAIFDINGEVLQKTKVEIIGVIYYKNGHIFYGFIKENEPSQGLMMQANGKKSQGLFIEHKISFGLTIFNNEESFFGQFQKGYPFIGTKQIKGQRFVGQFSRDFSISKGAIIYENGDRFQGEIQNQKKKSGSLVFHNGNKFKGKFFDGQMSEGILFYHDGRRFEGTFQQGRIFYGKLNSDEIGIFEGWFHDEIPFEGKQFDQKGNQLLGIFKNGKLYSGQKILRNGDFLQLLPMENDEIKLIKHYKSDSSKIEGIFKDNIPIRGTKTYENGVKFEGDFKDEKPYFGKIFYLEGVVFSGNFQNGNPQKGQLKFPDGRIFEGTFNPLSETHAPLYGKLSYPNGEYIEGMVKKVVIKNNESRLEFTNSLKKYENGNIFKGEFTAEKPSSGKLVFKNGDIFEGELSQDELPHRGKIDYQNRYTFDGHFYKGKPSSGKKYLNHCEYFQGNLQQISQEGKVSARNILIKKVYANGDILEAHFQSETLIPGQYKKTYGKDFVIGYFQAENIITEGQKHYQNGDCFIGIFQGEKISRGKMKTRGVGTFEGIFIDDNRAEGILINQKRDEYKGEFYNWKIYGPGKIRFQNGDQYSGLLNGNVFEGKGILSLQNGEKIQCQWKEGKKNGKVIVTQSKNLRRIESTWSNGIMQGQYYYEYIGQSSEPIKKKIGESQCCTIF